MQYKFYVIGVMVEMQAKYVCAVIDNGLTLFTSPFPLEYGTYPPVLLPLFAHILQPIRGPFSFKVSTSFSFERDVHTATLLQDTSVL